MIVSGFIEPLVRAAMEYAVEMNRRSNCNGRVGWLSRLSPAGA